LKHLERLNEENGKSKKRKFLSDIKSELIKKNNEHLKSRGYLLSVYYTKRQVNRRTQRDREIRGVELGEYIHEEIKK